VCIDVPTAALLSISLRFAPLFFFFCLGFFLFFFFAREILRPKDEEYAQSVAGRGLAHTTSFDIQRRNFLFHSARPSNKQTKKKEKKDRWFSFFLVFVSPRPFSIFFPLNEKKKKKERGTDNLRTSCTGSVEFNFRYFCVQVPSFRGGDNLAKIWRNSVRSHLVLNQNKTEEKNSTV
jgi:hypothetical protein